MGKTLERGLFAVIFISSVIATNHLALLIQFCGNSIGSEAHRIHLCILQKFSFSCGLRNSKDISSEKVSEVGLGINADFSDWAETR